MKITFELLNESHLPLLLKWLQAPHVKNWWDQDIVYTPALVKEKYGPYIKGSKQGKPLNGYIINLNQIPIGYIQIYNAYDFPRSKPLFGLPESLGAIDIFIGEEEYLGKNLGSQSILNFLNLYRSSYSHIFVDPDSANVSAIKSYEKAGFRKISEHQDSGEIWMIWESKIKRIMIFGKPGNGKSTFAIWLSDALNLPLHHLDKYFYTKNWIERDYPEFLNIQQNILNGDDWIIDGNCIKSLEMRWTKANLVLYFNFPLPICYFRILKRFVKPNNFDDRALGCHENIRLHLLKYIWNFEKRVSESISIFKQRYPNSIFKELKNDDDLNQVKFELTSRLSNNLQI